MSTAVITFVYNESVNLPIWIRHYGKEFGERHLYVVDRGSDDGSTNNLGDVNVVKVPRRDFDEYQKTDFMSNFHRSLLNFYDTVIITDCDELLVPEPSKFSGLHDYIEKSDFDYANCLGINVLHLITEEMPIDLTKPIMSQRKYGMFNSPCCKHLISRVPVTWLPGFHSSNRPPKFDRDLFMFHTKTMDYATSMHRQRVNIDTVWSAESLEKRLGGHHRFDFPLFVHQCFLVPIDLINRKMVSDFDFDEQMTMLKEQTQEGGGNYSIPMNLSKMVRIPERFRNSF